MKGEGKADIVHDILVPLRRFTRHGDVADIASLRNAKCIKNGVLPRLPCDDYIASAWPRRIRLGAMTGLWERDAVNPMMPVAARRASNADWALHTRGRSMCAQKISGVTALSANLLYRLRGREKIGHGDSCLDYGARPVRYIAEWERHHAWQPAFDLVAAIGADEAVADDLLHVGL